MRAKLALFGAVALAASTVALSAPAASAIQCPPGTKLQSKTVAGHTVNYCVPFVDCDPGSCDLAVAPR